VWAITEKETEADDTCFTKFPARVSLWEKKKKCNADNREELQ